MVVCPLEVFARSKNSIDGNVHIYNDGHCRSYRSVDKQALPIKRIMLLFVS